MPLAVVLLVLASAGIAAWGALRWRTALGRQRQLERSLASVELRHRSIMRGLADCVIIMDDQGRIQSFSPSAEKTFGYLEAEVIGRSVSILMPSPEREHHDRYVRDYVKSGWASGGNEYLVLTGDAHVIRPERDTVALRKDGSTFPARLMVSEVDTGKERFFIGLLSDVTEQKRNAAELKSAKEAAEAANAIIEAQKRRMQRELDVGREIQMSMVPGRFPTFAGTTLWGQLRPAREVGGDFYDFFQPTDGQLWICVGDVSGKGVPAALLMAVTKTLIKAFAAPGASPGQVCTRVNAELGGGNESGMFVTAFVARLDPASGDLCYTNAGHNPPLLRRATRDIVRLTTRHGPVLGASEATEYGESVDRLAPGDALLLYTDGVVEALDPRGVFFTDNRLIEVVRSLPVQSARELVSAVAASVDQFAEGAEQADDITLLCAHFQPPPSATTMGWNRLSVGNDPRQVAATVEQVEQLVGRWARDDATPRRFALVFDEVLSNIVKYAYPDGGAHQIDCEIGYDAGRIIATVVDDGVAFNPLEQPEPDRSSSLEDREVGGLGIHLARQLMDEMHYVRRNGCNELTLVKRMESPPEP